MSDPALELIGGLIALALIVAGYYVVRFVAGLVGGTRTARTFSAMNAGDEPGMIAARYGVSREHAEVLLGRWRGEAANRGLRPNDKAYWQQMADWMSAHRVDPPA